MPLDERTLGALLDPTPVPNLVNLPINAAAWERFLAAQRPSQNVEQRPEPAPVEEARMILQHIQMFKNPPQSGPTLEEQGLLPSALAQALGYSGIETAPYNNPILGAVPLPRARPR